MDQVFELRINRVKGILALQPHLRQTRLYEQASEIVGLLSTPLWPFSGEGIDIALPGSHNKDQMQLLKALNAFLGTMTRYYCKLSAYEKDKWITRLPLHVDYRTHVTRTLLEGSNEGMFYFARKTGGIRIECFGWVENGQVCCVPSPLMEAALIGSRSDPKLAGMLETAKSRFFAPLCDEKSREELHFFQHQMAESGFGDTEFLSCSDIDTKDEISFDSSSTELATGLLDQTSLSQHFRFEGTHPTRFIWNKNGMSFVAPTSVVQLAIAQPKSGFPQVQAAFENRCLWVMAFDGWQCMSRWERTKLIAFDRRMKASPNRYLDLISTPFTAAPKRNLRTRSRPRTTLNVNQQRMTIWASHAKLSSQSLKMFFKRFDQAVKARRRSSKSINPFTS